ncbi:beta-galactosidase [Alkalihalobacillus sp. NPDC078783]
MQKSKMEPVCISGEKNSFSPALPALQGKNHMNELLHFSNHFLMVDDVPIFGICGEFHFSRYDYSKWEDELLKMKMCGITIVPTYVIWNHHEEIKGEFDWQEDKALRTFIQLCGKHDLQCILRIGPFAHGEVRNGGLPDWLYGEPCRVRSNDERYIYYVDRLYKEIGKQAEGLMYKDGGPVIGIQLENEFYHAGAPWEFTSGTSNEWVSGGEDGEAHIILLKELAIQAGLVTPIYTATGWGGAIAPTDEVLPLWGGYAFWPWVFYDENVKEHPITPEFIYRDYNQETYNFDPEYDPASIPFACCEMGGGMTVFYNYRFALPYKSVEAMANIKVAGGCNFVGYYVFHGSSNPRGKRTPYLNENATPKISYDYQAPIGEFGQIRESYKRLKRQHYFYKDFEENFCQTTTLLPHNTDHMNPEDVDTLRYALRVNEGKGFIFINNYQDHIKTPTKHNLTLQFEINQKKLQIPHRGGFSIGEDVSCILPFHLSLTDVQLEYATAQLMKKVNLSDKEDAYFFFHPTGMKPSYRFERKNIKRITLSNGDIKKQDSHYTVLPVDKDLTRIDILSSEGKIIRIYTMSDEKSLNFWSFEWGGKHHAILTEAALIVEKDRIRFESESELLQVTAIDGLMSKTLESFFSERVQHTLHSEYSIKKKRVVIEPKIETIDNRRKLVSIPSESFTACKEILLNVTYEGDIGYAFINNELVHDNFNNGEVWQIGLSHLKSDLQENHLYLLISPIKQGRKVKSDSPMAARTELANKEIADIKMISLKPIYEFEAVANKT